VQSPWLWSCVFFVDGSEVKMLGGSAGLLREAYLRLSRHVCRKHFALDLRPKPFRFSDPTNLMAASLKCWVLLKQPVNVSRLSCQLHVDFLKAPCRSVHARCCAVCLVYAREWRTRWFSWKVRWSRFLFCSSSALVLLKPWSRQKLSCLLFG